MRRGKKTIARNIFRETLEEIKKKGSKDPGQVFERAIENVKPAMEVRPKRIGGAVYQIPIEVKPSRQLMLSFRWVMEAAKAKKGAKMAIKLAQELMDAANQTGSAIKKKEDAHKMAQANKAFAHLARY
ncbi:MAG: 30S ribosomal protein S7, small subunit ribosomal protein S7 [Candidatus Peregrinibacteria bacterium GW2011_GWF2_43_17]|nr:MAG: 30S ribosomal protein S7, small subunit ribosomal protein S7 [Candidatus Peregrinibacteria bacterium GW2011_GWF2_43_17]KKT19319.1 MAG: 30S ribosomal protein S7 [Candidatus Peregrinibacteria bacterium GW2011_GWA2_43_8]